MQQLGLQLRPGTNIGTVWLSIRSELTHNSQRLISHNEETGADLFQGIVNAVFRVRIEALKRVPLYLIDQISLCCHRAIASTQPAPLMRRAGSERDNQRQVKYVAIHERFNSVTMKLGGSQQSTTEVKPAQSIS